VFVDHGDESVGTWQRRLLDPAQVPVRVSETIRLTLEGLGRVGSHAYDFICHSKSFVQVGALLRELVHPTLVAAIDSAFVGA